MKEQLGTVVYTVLITGSENQLLCHFTYSENCVNGWDSIGYYLTVVSGGGRFDCLGHSDDSNWS